MYIGLYLLLKGRAYANNSIFFPSEIGESYGSTQNNALQCITDLKPCCTYLIPHYMYLMDYVWKRPGNWFFPNGTEVYHRGRYYISFSLYRNRGAYGNINLNHIEDSTVKFPTGLYCCVAPDANRTNKTLCASIGKCNPHFMCIICNAIN